MVDTLVLPEMVTIPPGEFLMGCSDDDKFANAHERPQHWVKVQSFELSKYPVFEADTRLPSVNVSWYDAGAFCGELRDGYRLPTEAEWEYACRAGTTTPFPSGHLPDPDAVNYYYDEHGNRTGPGKRLQVGWGRPNAFGLHDMLGNVCEWVEDSWRTNYDSAASDERWKVVRGGAWDYLPRLLRSSWRDFAPTNTRRDNLGFRVARSL